jgi:hypothetical protein
MGAFYKLGQQMIRPGIFFRISNAGGASVPGVGLGKCAAVFRSNWGPLGAVIYCSEKTQVEQQYGAHDGITNLSDVAVQQLRNVTETACIRLGTGGTRASLLIKDGSVAPGVDVGTLRLKYPGTRQITVSIQVNLYNSQLMDIIAHEGTRELERLTFPIAANVVDNLRDTVNGKSEYFEFTKMVNGNGTLRIIAQSALTGGVDPVITSLDYDNALNVLEPFEWDVLAIDSEDAAIFTLVQSYINNIFQRGKLVRAVVGQGSPVVYATRLTNLRALNDFLMHYCINGFIENGENIQGYRAAARISGLVASVTAPQSLAHYVIKGATGLTENFENRADEIISAGGIVFTMSSKKQVWIESGVNTLVLPDAGFDEGWKKIRRVTTRFEVMKRINTATEGLIGRVNNDKNGRATVRMAAQGVINSMINEEKLLEGAQIFENPDFPAQGDSMWFKFIGDDPDSGEKFYFDFMFRFAPIQ